MNRKFYFSFAAFALTLAATVALVSGNGFGTRTAAVDGSAASMLPASDFVVVVDARRALSDALPNLLAGSPGLLGKLNAELEKFERETGINPRSIETVAVGGRLSSAKGRKDDAVIILRGSFNSEQLLEAAFAHAQEQAKAQGRGELQKEEQQYEGKKLFLFSHTRTQNDGTRGRSDRMAVAIIDSNTLAVGDLDSARAAVDASLGRNRVDDELVRLATATPGAMVGFSGRAPQGTTTKIGPGDMPGAKYFESIREFYGSFGTTGADAEAAIALRTENADQARDIGQAINAVKGFASIGFSSRGKDARSMESFAEILKGLTITTQGNEVQINLRIPQSSLGALMRLH